MRTFFEISKRAFRLQMSYRAATIAGLLTNFFFGWLRAIVMIALYNGREEMLGIGLPEIVTYTAVTQAIISFLSIFRWFEVSNTVYSGEIGADLLKPMDYTLYWMARDFGRAAAALLTRGLPILLAYSFFFKIVFPQSPSHWAALLIVLVLAWLVSFGWRYLVNLPAFWVPNALGITRFFFVAALFFSGFMMPLRFFPAWVQNLAQWTPFPSTINAIIEVYLGLSLSTDLLKLIVTQLAWIVILLVAGQLVLKAGIKRLVVLGG